MAKNDPQVPQAQQPMTDDELMMQGGAVRDRALFFKGETIGEWIIGQVSFFTQRKFEGNANASDVAILSPAAVLNPVTKEWQYCREAQLVLGAALAQMISPRTDRGKIFAIRFDGTTPSQKGNDARLYTVVEQTAAKLGSVLQKAQA
jgi:hypothetical protein